MKSFSYNFIDCLDWHDSLQEINLNNTTLTNDALYRLAAALRTNRTLRTLNIDKNSAGTLHYSEICRALKENCSLVELSTPIYDIKKMPDRDLVLFKQIWPEIEKNLQDNRNQKSSNNTKIISALESQNSSADLDRIQLMINYLRRFSSNLDETHEKEYKSIHKNAQKGVLLEYLLGHVDEDVNIDGQKHQENNDICTEDMTEAVILALEKKIKGGHF